jgi:endonuclease/exonuclease/phosphatase family metal-dependent hydrolase
VLCAQEVLEVHAPQMADLLGMQHWFFSPMHRRHRIGVAIFSQYPLEDMAATYCGRFKPGSAAEVVFQEATIRLDGLKYRFGNTLFSWAPSDEYSTAQQENLPRLVRAIDPSRPIVLCGDLNMPRGINPGWTELKRYWTDNIPDYCDSTLDPVFHPAVYAQHKKLVVDAVFSSAPYLVRDVRLHGGVSDHLLISATVSQSKPCQTPRRS